MTELRPSYFTADERARLSFEPFAPGDPPIGFMDVSHTQLSIARHYGGGTVRGRHYVYFPQSDELWREDILALVHGWRKEAAKQKPAEPAPIQGKLL